MCWSKAVGCLQSSAGTTIQDGIPSAAASTTLSAKGWLKTMPHNNAAGVVKIDKNLQYLY